MIRIGDLAADAATGEYVLLTNGVGDDQDYAPYEGLVFETVDGCLVGWRIRNVQSRVLRRATSVEEGVVLPWYRARLAAIPAESRKYTREKNRRQHDQDQADDTGG